MPWLFHGPTPAVTQRIAEVEAWIREDLGDFRSFSLDSPASRQERIDALDGRRGSLRGRRRRHAAGTAGRPVATGSGAPVRRRRNPAAAHAHSCSLTPA